MTGRICVLWSSQGRERRSQDYGEGQVISSALAGWNQSNGWTQEKPKGNVSRSGDTQEPCPASCWSNQHIHCSLFSCPSSMCWCWLEQGVFPLQGQPDLYYFISVPASRSSRLLDAGSLPAKEWPIHGQMAWKGPAGLFTTVRAGQILSFRHPSSRNSLPQTEPLQNVYLLTKRPIVPVAILLLHTVFSWWEEQERWNKSQIRICMGPLNQTAQDMS